MNILVLVAYSFLLAIMGSSRYGYESTSVLTFADRWNFVGIAVSEPGYTIWGTSPILGDDGKIHLFVARWPAELQVDPGWRSHSEVAHYIGDSPLGPFRFSDIALKGSGEDTWDKFGAHNPAIQKVGSKYVLLYIGNDNPKPPVHPSNQKIGMATSSSLYGPWKKVNGDGLILACPDNEGFWNFKASNGVNNPAFLQHPDGRYFLYFKSEGGKMGLAIASDVEGPQVLMIDKKPAYLYAPSGYRFFGGNSTASYVLEFEED